jgi:hypothetical protein
VKISTALFADDTTLISDLSTFCPNSKPMELSSNINIEITKIATWLKANKLSLNITKTKFMIFECPGTRPMQLALKLDKTSIDCVEHFNFLGLIVQKFLNWSLHTKHISLKISRAAGILNHLKYFLPKITLITIYHAFITPHLKLPTFKLGLQLQKKSIRIITASHFLAHSEPLFKRLKILSLPDLHSFIQMKFLYKVFHNDLPAIL